MLTIRKQQMEAFEKAKLDEFVRAMAQGLAAAFPSLCGPLPAAELEDVTRRALDRADLYGIRTERDLSRYLNIAAVFGPDLDRDPALPWAAAILKSDAPPEVRMERLHQKALTKVASARGPRARVDDIGMDLA